MSDEPRAYEYNLAALSRGLMRLVEDAYAEGFEDCCLHADVFAEMGPIWAESDARKNLELCRAKYRELVEMADG